jgi:hypothetical protein
MKEKILFQIEEFEDGTITPYELVKRILEIINEK